MENEVVVFRFQGKQDVRTVTINGEPWWVLKDVCGILSITNQGNVATRLDDDEKADVHLTDTSSQGVTQQRNMNVVNESGLYNVILRSDKPEAKAFKKWITSEVLPTIRKTGAYAIQALSPLEILKNQVAVMERQDRELKEVNERLNTIEAKMTTRNENMFTTAGYAALHGHKIVTTEAAQFGRKATKLSKELGIATDTTYDPRFGKVNLYYKEVLKKVMGY